MTAQLVKCEGCGVWHFPDDPCPAHAGDYVAAPRWLDPEAIGFANMCYTYGPEISAEAVTRNIVEAYLNCAKPCDPDLYTQAKAFMRGGQTLPHDNVLHVARKFAAAIIKTG